MKLLITGYIILIVAIFANIIANYLNILSWYKFLNLIISEGVKETIFSISIFDFFWLFIIYPTILSMGYLLGEKIYNFIVL